MSGALAVKCQSLAPAPSLGCDGFPTVLGAAPDRLGGTLPVVVIGIALAVQCQPMSATDLFLVVSGALKKMFCKKMPSPYPESIAQLFFMDLKSDPSNPMDAVHIECHPPGKMMSS